MIMEELNLFCFITNLAVAVLVGAILPILPAITRKSFLFGVKIPIEEHDCAEAKKLTNNYIAVCLSGALAIIALIVAQFLAFPDMSLISVMYFPLLFAAVQAAAFIPNWKRAVKLKEQKGWKVSSSSFAETKSSYSRGNLADLPWIWYIAGLILIFLSIVVIFAQYPHLPDLIPTHFDFNMQPDAWSDKSLLALLMLPLINIATLALMFGVNVMFVKAKLQIDPQNPELSFAQHCTYRRRMGHSLGFLTLGIVMGFLIIGFFTVFPDFTLPFWLIMAVMLIPVAPIIVIPIASGQGGCRIKPKTTGKTQKAESAGRDPSDFDKVPGRGDDKYWALGMFYHNPEDPAVFVEDRFGNNLGFNYSRLPVKLGAVFLFLALAGTYAWIMVLIGNYV